MTDSEWTPPNTRYYCVMPKWYGIELYLGGDVAALEEPYSMHLSMKKAKELGEKWVEDGNA